MAAKIPAREQFSTSPHVKEGRHQMRSGDSLYINPIVLAGGGGGGGGVDRTMAPKNISFFTWKSHM